MFGLPARGTYRDLGGIEVSVVNASTAEVHPTGRQAFLNGLERHIQVDDSIHTVHIV